ncbi:MAG: FtsB family cell division protein [Candidatus Zixiibacteriota bacterium]
MEEQKPETEKKDRFRFFRSEPADFQKLPKWLKRLLAIAAILVVLFFFLGGEFGLINYMRYKHYESKLRRLLADEQAKTDSLNELIDKLQNDTLYIESLARERLNMVKPGETMILFKEKGQSEIIYDTTAPRTIGEIDTADGFGDGVADSVSGEPAQVDSLQASKIDE